MAKLAQEIYRKQEQINYSRPVIIRFCGSSAGTIALRCKVDFNPRCLTGSSTQLELVRSICRQIHAVLGHDLQHSSHLLICSSDECLLHFYRLVEGTVGCYADLFI